MYPGKDVLLVLGLTISIIILINVGIILRFRKSDRKRDTPYRAFGRAIDIARNPWKKEDEQLNELASILDSLKEEKDEGENTNS